MTLGGVSDWLQRKKTHRWYRGLLAEQRAEEARESGQGPWKHYYQGMYKVLVNGHTVDEAPGLAEAREVAQSLASTLSEGDIINIRQSNPAKRHIEGYFEPNREAYKVQDGEAVLVAKSRKGSPYGVADL